MASLLQRNLELARRCKDLSPLAVPIRDRLWNANRDVIMARVSPGTTRPVAILRPWAGPPPSYPKRKGSGPERAPHGESSRIIAGCVVSVIAGTGRLSILKSWPSLGEVAVFLNYGTSRMVARPFMEYRAIDMEFIRKELQEYIIAPTFGQRASSFVRGLFGRS